MFAQKVTCNKECLKKGKNAKNIVPRSLRTDQSSPHSDQTLSPRKYSLPDTSIHGQASRSATHTERLPRPVNLSIPEPPLHPPRPTMANNNRAQKSAHCTAEKRRTDVGHGRRGHGLTEAPGNAAAISETASAASRDWHLCNDREDEGLKTVTTNESVVPGGCGAER